MSGKIDNMVRALAAFLPDYGAKMHVRQIARLVKMNRQTASETLRKMEMERILDSEISGRNKLYFINKSSQKAKMLMQDAENGRKLDICSKQRAIARLVEYLQGDNVVLLFGSFAKGIERKESDIDLLVIGGKIELEDYEKEVGREVQPIAMNEKKFIEKLRANDHLVVEVARNHVCLKNTERFVDLMWRAVYG